MKCSWEDLQGLAMRVHSEGDETAIERAYFIMGVESYGEGRKFYFSRFLGNKNLVDEAILDIAKKIKV